ncbi:MAG TPA: hypothetical protein VNP04_24735 [Alphaproteobacteria bacterium]|nr:hypothetical protein [Alphaproteobacteria bacterium]
MSKPIGLLRPAEFCRQLIATLDASEGRRRRRKRDTTPDAIGMAVKRELLEQTIGDDPDPQAFEAWLLQRCLAAGAGSGALRAMALEVLNEWRLAAAAPSFRDWLRQGAPSDDASA